MKLILNNNSSDAFSYLNGSVVVPANSSLDVDVSNWFLLYSDIPFMADVRNSNLQISDGVKTYQYPESELYLQRLIIGDNEANRDTDGAFIVRNKAAKRGWTFCAMPIEFQTSRLSDVMFCQDMNGVQRSFITLKAYDQDDVEVTTAGTDDINYASIVKTVIDFEPPYDYEVIGGSMRTIDVINDDIRLWLIAAPDIPAPYGSKEMSGGINLRYLAPGNVWEVDGRVAKFAPYSATVHSNKIRMIFKYDAGVNEYIQVIIQHYKQ